MPMGIDSVAKRTMVIAAILLALSLLFLFAPLKGSTEFLPEHIEAMQMRDSTAQRAAHLIWVIFLGVTCSAILISRPRQRD